MMNFVLVPFLLAARVLPNQDGWINGPKYTFDVRVGTIATQPYVHEEHLQGSSIFCKLICRPREPHNLICHIEDAKITKLSPIDMDTNETMPRADAVFVPFEYDSPPFEIKFDNKGIDSYIIEDSSERMVSQFVLDMDRMIANQLSIGADLKGKGEQFQLMENFTVGECPTIYTINRTRTEQEKTRKTFSLTSLIDLEIPDNEKISIIRKRDMKCISASSYSFGTRDVYGVIPRTTTKNLMSSATRMEISKQSFVSETVNILESYNSQQEVGIILDHIYLSLESIQPAESKLQLINNPISVGIKNTSPRKVTQYFMA